MRVRVVAAWTPCLIFSSCLFLSACGGSSQGAGTGGGAQTAGLGGGPSGVGGANPAHGGSHAGAGSNTAGSNAGAAGGAPSGGATNTGGAGMGGQSGGADGSGAGGTSGASGTAGTSGSSGSSGTAGTSGTGGTPGGSCDPLSCPALGTCTVTPLAQGCERTCKLDQPYQGASDADVASLAALGCTVIDGALAFVHLDASNQVFVHNLVGLESIREITGSLTIDGGKLVDLKGLDGLQTVKTFTVQRLDIQSIELPALKHVGQFTATDLPKLTVLRLPALDTADTGVMITTCSLLQSVELNALKSVTQELNISMNNELLKLNGLPKLKSVPTLRVLLNPKLPQCEVDAIATRLGSATTCTCVGNDSSATCP